jgi:hypothetical protein
MEAQRPDQETGVILPRLEKAAPRRLRILVSIEQVPDLLLQAAARMVTNPLLSGDFGHVVDVCL